MRCERISLERALFALAAAMTLLAAGLAVALSSWFLVLAVFVAFNQWLYAWTGDCPASLVLQRTPCFSREVAR